MTRRFPAPLVRPRTPSGVCRVGRERAGSRLRLLPARDENEARQANVLTHDEARRIASKNITKLSELLTRKGEE
jgi:hypothetical protein